MKSRQSKTKAYLRFLESKIKGAVNHASVSVDESLIHESTKPHQHDVILWSLTQERALIAASFGLGKTQIESEIARLLIAAHPGSKFLVVTPLGVRHQFIDEDGPRLGIKWQYVYDDASIEAADTPFLITNYERVRDGNITPAKHPIIGVSLDEGDVIRSLGTKTVDVFRKTLEHIRYRFVATATPDPNDYKELIYFADFLGVMDSGQALTRWFKRNPDKAGDLQIHPQYENDFWLWVSTWALFLYSPADMGYDDSEYQLPELNVHWHCVGVDHTRAFAIADNYGQRKLLISAAKGVTQSAREKRATMPARIAKMLEVISAEPNDANSAGTESSLLRSEPRAGTSEVVELLPQEQTQPRSAKEAGVHGGVSQDLQAQAENIGTSSGAESSPSRKVRQRSGVSGEESPTREDVVSGQSREESQSAVEGGLRNHTGSIQQNVGSAKRRLRNLRNDDSDKNQESSLCRSQSQNGKGERDSLSPLQLRDRPLSGQPQSTDEGSGLPQTHWLIWHQLEDERRAIEQALPGVASVYGSQDLEVREKNILNFSHGHIPILSSKPQLTGSGCNFQRHCYSNVFVGVDYRFKDFIQAVHRTFRFLQKHAVDIHIVYAESEQSIIDELRRKWKQYDEQCARMREIIRTYGLDHRLINEELKRKIGVHRVEVSSERFTAVNNDCVLEMENIEDDSVGLIHTSIPFGNHYEYTANYEDFGHNENNARFFAQMDFLIPELLRVLKPGRVAAIHVKDRILYGHQTKSGIMEVDEFSDLTVRAFKKHGFLYEGRRTIVTDVVRENASTYRLGWTEMCKDASKMGSGLPEYLLLFRKAPTGKTNARADEPVTKQKADYKCARWQFTAHGFWRSDGDVLVPTSPEEVIRYLLNLLSVKDPYNFEAHVAKMERVEDSGMLPASFMADPPESRNTWVWDDVVMMRSLNSNQSRRQQVNHMCPLPLDIVERAIKLYSNPGDVVFDPFAGLFTVPYCAVKFGRYGHGVELSQDYFRDGLRYCKEIEAEVSAPTLFDLMEQTPLAESAKEVAA